MFVSLRFVKEAKRQRGGKKCKKSKTRKGRAQGLGPVLVVASVSWRLSVTHSHGIPIAHSPMAFPVPTTYPAFNVTATRRRSTKEHERYEKKKKRKHLRKRNVNNREDHCKN